MYRRILTVVLIGLFIATNSFGASQWSKLEPVGTRNASDIDYWVATINNEAQDRLLYDYIHGCDVYYIAAGSVGIATGEIAIPNAGGTIVRYRRNTSAVTLDWTDLDTGSEANSTQYYVYAVADTDATTFTGVISANATSPQGGETYYRKIGSFYNNSGGDVECGGRIMMWSGTTDTIPDGWVLCDGNNGTPDLRNYFIYGAGDNADPGDSATSGLEAGTGSAITMSTGSNNKQDGSGTCTAQNVNVMPSYYALAFIMKKGG